MDLSDGERDLLLAGLFALSTMPDADDEQRLRCTLLARKLGGDPDAAWFAAPSGSDVVDRLGDLPGVEDRPDGIYSPHAVNEGEEALAVQTLAVLLADCIANGRHHLATLDHPDEGMVLGCTHCHRYWRTTR